MPEAIFERAGDLFVPTGLARGPWDPNAQHGGAPGALIATLLARLEPGSEMPIARLTFEFLRPIPLEPLSVTTGVIRAGRRVQWLEASMRAGDVEVCRAHAVRIRRDPEVAVPAPVGPPPAPMPAPTGVEPMQRLGRGEGIWFTDDALEVRSAEGGFDEPGPAKVWFRLRYPVIAGEPIEPLARALAAADFANGIGSELPWNEWIFINADLTVTLRRHPVGEWVGLDAHMLLAPDGVGSTVSVMHDERGAIGEALQTLLISTP